MRFFWLSISTSIAIALSGCGVLSSRGPSPFSVSDQKNYYEPKGDRIYSLFDHDGSSVTPKTQASIGDSLFVVSRFNVKDSGSPAVKNLWGDPYPSLSKGSWYSSHTFSEEGKIYRVYTHSDFHEGTIGVILDEAMRIPFEEAFVRVTGSSPGKRWKAISPADVGKPFFLGIKIFEKWGLRYSGKDGNLYVFDIFDRPNANVSTVIQTIKITERNFLSGFVVRGVKITGAAPDVGGVINFTYSETFKENLDSDRNLFDKRDSGTYL